MVNNMDSILKFFKKNNKDLVSAPFSDFVRTGKSKEKKKVFNAVLQDSITEQKRVIAKAQKKAKA